MGKKVAFLNIYQGKVYRGVETYITELSKRISKEHEVDIISDVNYFKIFKSSYDVIIPTNGRLQVLLIRLITWIKGTKMVVSGQSGPGADDKWNLLCMPDVFIGISEYAAKWAKKFNPFVNVAYIPNGVDLINFKESARPVKLGLPHPIVLSVGALVPGKRQDLLIQAVSKTSASLVLVGKGSLENEYERIGNDLLKDRFKIVSFKHSEMPGVYAACDLFSFPTVPWESFGIVMVEAMASNLPVVASDDPIRREIVGNAGLFVDPTDADEYAKILEKALSIKWGSKPRRQAERYSWDDIARQYCKLIGSL